MNSNDKFAVIYSFVVIEGRENNFIDAWTELTKLFYQYAGSNGSRLHKSDKQLFIAYAQWPNKDAWQNSGNKLPELANKVRQQMRDCCSEIETVHELSIVEDLLNDQQHNNSLKSI